MSKIGLPTRRSLTAATAAAGIILACGAQSAFAQSPADESVRVNADLSTDAGVHQLLHKIRMASVKVCAGQGSDPVYATDGYFGCVRRTTAEAVARADIPQLTALYRGGNGAVVMASRR